MKPEDVSTEDHLTPKPAAAVPGVAAPVDGSASSFNPQQLMHAQEYMLRRQQEIVDAALKENNRLVRVANKLALENEKLRRELDGYRRNKLWTMLVAMLPTQEMLRRE